MNSNRYQLINFGGTISSYAGAGRTGTTSVTGFAESLEKLIMTKEFHAELNTRWEHQYRREPAEPVKLAPLDYPGFTGDSTQVVPKNWRSLAQYIREHYEQYDAFIITHGTNSMAYTASAVAFALPFSQKPIIFTGANVPLGTPASDAAMNAANAVLLAQYMCAKQLSGVAVVFASRIISGVRAKKVSGTELEAFSSFNAPLLGTMRPKQVLIRRAEYARYRANTGAFLNVELEGASTPDPCWIPPRTESLFDAIVDSRTFHPGDDPTVYRDGLDSLQQRATRDCRAGMIIRAVGDGDLPDDLQSEVLAYAKEREVPVVVTTQEPGGISSFRSNDISKRVRLESLAIPAWDMSIETIVVKLRYLLSLGYKYNEICSLFTTQFLGEVNVESPLQPKVLDNADLTLNENFAEEPPDSNVYF